MAHTSLDCVDDRLVEKFGITYRAAEAGIAATLSLDESEGFSVPVATEAHLARGVAPIVIAFIETENDHAWRPTEAGHTTGQVARLDRIAPSPPPEEDASSAIA